MSIFIKIAWRNIWRNPRRSWVLISALAVGVFSFLGAVAYIDGFSIQMIDSAINLGGGHIQVSARGYHENPTIRTYLPDVARVEQVAAGIAGVRYAPLAATPGMINSAEQASGVIISGVDPVLESHVTTLDSSIVEGVYLSPEGDANEVVIGVALAERLNVLLGEKIVLMANDLDNEVSAGAYRIVGLYRTNSSDFDKANVYLHLDQARALVGYTAQQASTVTMRLDPSLDLVETAVRLRMDLDDAGLEVLTWRDRSPLLVMMNEMMDLANVFLVVILFTAIAFTLINSFIMVIFERIREIGIMSANGVRPSQVRLMLYLEAVFIVLLGMALGGLLAFGLIAYWSAVGLDLSAFAEGLSSFGASSVIYPYVHWGHITSGFVMIFIMVLLAVLYPAIKASRFEIVEAINYV
ncbi:MAG: ABC transporter permease [Bacteroidetes bacterium]|nr:ABC transporter permease [Bacteroidota bacterium]